MRLAASMWILSQCLKHLVATQALQRVQRSTKQDMQLARKQLHLAKAQLAEVRRTAHPRPESAPGFCGDINRNLMAPVPSKPVTVSSADDWVVSLIQHFTQAQTYLAAGAFIGLAGDYCITLVSVRQQRILINQSVG